VPKGVMRELLLVVENRREREERPHFLSSHPLLTSSPHILSSHPLLTSRKIMSAVDLNKKYPNTASSAGTDTRTDTRTDTPPFPSLPFLSSPPPPPPLLLLSSSSPPQGAFLAHARALSLRVGYDLIQSADLFRHEHHTHPPTRTRTHTPTPIPIPTPTHTHTQL